MRWGERKKEKEGGRERKERGEGGRERAKAGRSERKGRGGEEDKEWEVMGRKAERERKEKRKVFIATVSVF